MSTLAKLKFFVNTLISFFENGEAGFLGIAHGERLGHRRSVDLGNDFLNRMLAQWARYQRAAINRASELKSFGADAARRLGVVGSFRNVFVNGHKKGAGRVIPPYAGN